MAVIAAAPLMPAQATGGQPATVLRGVVRAPDGQPLAGARLAVGALHNLPGRTVVRMIDTAVADADGRYTFTGALPQKVSGNPDGTVTLQIDVFGGGREKTFNLDVRPPAAVGARWETAKTTAAPSMTLGMAGGWTTAALKQAARTFTTDGARIATAGSSCPGPNSFETWLTTKTSTRRYVPIQQIRLRNRATMSYSWSTTARTKMQVAYAGAYSHYAGGLAFSWSHDRSTGYGPARVRTSYWAGHLEVQWRYRKQRQACSRPDGSYTYTGKTRWHPAHWTGGNQRDRDSAVGMWRCKRGTKTKVRDQIWAARTTTSRVGGEFSIAGVSLDATQANSSNHRLRIIARPGRRAWICGSNRDPIYASRVKEIIP